MIVFYDFETNGLLYKDGRPLGSQPHIVQAGAILVDQDWKIVASVDEIVRPTRWRISKESTEIHSISYEFAKEHGKPEDAVFADVKKLVQQSKLCVAHNEEFDREILRIASLRFDGGELAKKLKIIPAFCTMHHTIDICKIPPTSRMRAAGRNNYKSPKLTEAYEHLFNEKLPNSHNATADLLACKRIYEHLNNTPKSFWHRLFG